ncbi:MAG: hypothetical protein K0Q81_1916 [Paenibacillus sp.]|jgi:hypothetical protein|nr:hypothetical protein [Paenibacillus sp.]
MRIDDMKPGPELDAKVAKLFGINISFDHEEGRFRRYQESPFGEILVPFEPSTSWEGMRLVVEEMQRRGWEYAIESEGEKVHARFFKPLEGDYAEQNGETSAPTACVKAAIKALQGEDTQP